MRLFYLNNNYDFNIMKESILFSYCIFIIKTYHELDELNLSYN